MYGMDLMTLWYLMKHIDAEDKEAEEEEEEEEY